MDCDILFKRNKLYLAKCDCVDCFPDVEVENFNVWDNGEEYSVSIHDWQEVIIAKEFQGSIDNILVSNIIHNPLQIGLLYLLHSLLRHSDRCGFDNRMSLYYDDFHLFYASMFVVNWEEILKDNQFHIYFNKDYINSPHVDIKPLSIREMDRIAMFYQPQNCGYLFFKEIITKNKYVIYKDGCVLHRYLQNVEIKIGINNLIKNIFSSSKKVSAGEFVTALRGMGKLYEELERYFGEHFKNLLNKFDALFGRERELSVSDIFKGIFIASYYLQYGNNFNFRIVPLIVFFPDHFLKCMELYDAILDDFNNVYFFRLVRNPIIRTIRGYEYIKKYNVHYIVKFIDVLTEELMFDEYSVRRGNSFCVRFEDLKNRPEEVMKAVCSRFAIPCDERMFENREIFRKDSLNPKLDPIFTEKDIEKLAILYKPILMHYQYNEKEIDGDVKTLIGHSFGFEKELADYLKIDFSILHIAVQSRISQIMKNNKLKFPELLS